MKLWLDAMFIIFLFFLFFLSAFDKLYNSKNSRKAITNYGFSESIAKKLYMPLAIFEFILAFSYLISGIMFYNLFLTSAFLICSSVLIMKNIRKGNRNMACGCGGILENEELSATIIYRNGAILLLILYLYIAHGILLTSIYDNILLGSITISFLFIIAGIKELNQISKIKKQILKYF